MTKEQIIKSGFVTAFITDYFENKSYSFYPDKDRLRYILCNSEQEKKEVTIKQIEKTKAKISKLGFEDLSFAYLLSCKPDSRPNYIEPNKRFDFWLHRFSKEFEDNIIKFDPITKAVYLFNKVPELTSEVFENESEFWEWYPKAQCPKTMDFISIIPNEADLLSQIEYDIQEYNKNEYWEFDFEEYERFIDVSKPIEILFNLCELLVQLDRLEMFNEFREIEPISKPKPEQENPKDFEELFYNTELITPCIDILKELDPPLIDTDYNYIGKLKGVICVWIGELQRQGIVKSNYTDERKLFASLIPQKIKRFSIDESMFGKPQKKAEENYGTDIKTKVSKIKLSQNSH
ncbi:hypothetical protein [Psychroflexus sp. MES1-P1E]|uniref:hypothetical protein n=1 Tax=Psychroflexus sp. MES1-P1E TaxID=2058320 RepID=UPI000C7CBECF|nr:hypothetical protein [Psychroflexus sp. MES1-P1E]PKG44056.1 hypothetical protein CXF67_01715 [Psychroflexus sp. MES1-P1E]